MYERAGHLVRVAALSVFVIGTSHDDVEAVVLAQRDDESRTAASLRTADRHCWFKPQTATATLLSQTSLVASYDADHDYRAAACRISRRACSAPARAAESQSGRTR